MRFFLKGLLGFRPKRYAYWVHDNPKGSDLCPLCDVPLSGCAAGCYCKNKKCPGSYVDGYAYLTNKEKKKAEAKGVKFMT